MSYENEGRVDQRLSYKLISVPSVVFCKVEHLNTPRKKQMLYVEILSHTVRL